MKKSQLRNFAPAERRVIAAKTPEKSDGRTQAQYLQECDINHIVNTYKRADDPFPAQRASGVPQYVDLPDATDLHSALNTVAEATSAFNSLPSNIRERYLNDPVKFVAALRDDAEIPFLVDSGVLDVHERHGLPVYSQKNLEAPAGPQTPPKQGDE